MEHGGGEKRGIIKVKKWNDRNGSASEMVSERNIMVAKKMDHGSVYVTAVAIVVLVVVVVVVVVVMPTLRNRFWCWWW